MKIFRIEEAYLLKVVKISLQYKKCLSPAGTRLSRLFDSRERPSPASRNLFDASMEAFDADPLDESEILELLKASNSDFGMTP